MSQLLKTLLNIIKTISALFPLLWLSGVFIFTIRVSIYLGYWPEPNKPDPQFIPFDFFYNILIEAMRYLLPSSIVIIIFSLQKKIKLVEHKSLKYMHVLGWFMIIVFFITPKINFVGWFLD